MSHAHFTTLLSVFRNLHFSCLRSIFSVTILCTIMKFGIVINNILVHNPVNIRLIMTIGGREEGWLEFVDLWSGQKPWCNWYLTPVVNFGEVQRAQLAKSTLLTSMLVPLGSFQVCSNAKERVGCRKQQEATALIQSLVKLQPWFLSLQWKTCLQ